MIQVMKPMKQVVLLKRLCFHLWHQLKENTVGKIARERRFLEQLLLGKIFIHCYRLWKTKIVLLLHLPRRCLLGMPWRF
ncbi:hypothetical protein ACS0TY_022333 [Phlomoides rotata]